MNEEIARYLRELREQGSENAYFNLIDLAHSVVPDLIEAYWHEPSRSFRLTLVEAIWEHRLSSSLGFLGEVLQDSDTETWRAALDGIVAFNGPEGLQILISEKERLSTAVPYSQDRLEWIEEAIAQMNENLSTPN